MFRLRFHWQKCTFLCFAWLFPHRDTAAAVLGCQGAAPCSLYSCGDSRCVLYICVWNQTKHCLGSLAIGLLGLLEPWLMYFTLFWGQCDFQTTAFQWIDSASLKVISAGETISTLVPGRQTLMSGCRCHVSLWMNISCAASSSTSASPLCSVSLLCLLALHCPLHLSLLYSFLSPAPGLQSLSTHLLGWWLLRNTRACSAETPSPGALFSRDARGFCGNSPFCWSYSGSLWICTIWQKWPLLAQWLQ